MVDLIGSLVYVDSSWHRVIDAREQECLIVSFDWWVKDRWVFNEKIESKMADTGQFD